jgi:hypothetical protein
MTSRPSSQSALEFLKDDEGSAVFGWVGEGVFYTRFRGGLSAQVGLAHVARLGVVLGESRPIRYFSDASGLKHYDLAARSAFVRLVTEHRARFSSLVMLTWASGITPSAQAFATAMGGAVTLLTSATEFDARLAQEAPFVKRKLHPNAWVRSPLPGALR